MPFNTALLTVTAFSALAISLAIFPAAPGPPAKGITHVTQPPAAASGGFARGEPVPALHIRLGSDSNACGITPPAGGPPRGEKAGLVVWLHGGMRSANREKGFEAHRAWLGYLPAGRYYLCSPSAYGGAEWTTPVGLAHIEALIDHMSATYAVDPADLNLVGVSDGCLGVIAYSLKGRHIPRHRVLISSAPQLALPAENLAGQPRFAQGRWDFLQGGRDRLFPAEQVLPYLRRFTALYPNARLHEFPEGEHDFSWYAQHAREPMLALFRPHLRPDLHPDSRPDPPAHMPRSRTQKTPAPGSGISPPERKN